MNLRVSILVLRGHAVEAKARKSANVPIYANFPTNSTPNPPAKNSQTPLT
jgi:hypothetical protein